MFELLNVFEKCFFTWEIWLEMMCSSPLVFKNLFWFLRLFLKASHGQSFCLADARFNEQKLHACCFFCSLRFAYDIALNFLFVWIMLVV